MPDRRLAKPWKRDRPPQRVPSLRYATSTSERGAPAPARPARPSCSLRKGTQPPATRHPSDGQKDGSARAGHQRFRIVTGIQRPWIGRAALREIVQTSREVGVDEGGCSATRATARCACTSPRIRPRASTLATPATAAKERSRRGRSQRWTVEGRGDAHLWRIGGLHSATTKDITASAGWRCWGSRSTRARPFPAERCSSIWVRPGIRSWSRGGGARRSTRRSARGRRGRARGALG